MLGSGRAAAILVESKSVKGRVVVRVAAAMIEVANSRRLQRELEELVRTTEGPLIMDLSATSFISSSGAGVLAYVIGLLKDRRRSVRLVTPHAAVRQLFRVTKLLTFDHVLLVETVDEAFESLR